MSEKKMRNKMSSGFGLGKSFVVTMTRVAKARRCFRDYMNENLKLRAQSFIKLGRRPRCVNHLTAGEVKITAEQRRVILFKKKKRTCDACLKGLNYFTLN